MFSGTLVNVNETRLFLAVFHAWVSCRGVGFGFLVGVRARPLYVFLAVFHAMFRLELGEGILIGKPFSLSQA